MKKNGIRVGKYRIIFDKTLSELKEKVEKNDDIFNRQMTKINELHNTVETYKKLLDIEQQNTRMNHGK
jgi:hypothetical protein